MISHSDEIERKIAVEWNNSLLPTLKVSICCPDQGFLYKFSNLVIFLRKSSDVCLKIVFSKTSGAGMVFKVSLKKSKFSFLQLNNFDVSQSAIPSKFFVPGQIQKNCLRLGKPFYQS